MTGGEDPAVLLKDDNTKLDKSKWDTFQNNLVNLNEYKVQYKHVEYTISVTDNNEMMWENLQGMGSISSTLTGNVKFKKDLIGDAISRIYGVEADYFKQEIAKGKPGTDGKPIDSSTISKVSFTNTGKITVTYKENELDNDAAATINEKDVDMTIKITDFNLAPLDWQQKVMDYYLQTINQTTNISELGRPAGIVKRLVRKVATGKSMDAQLLEQKAKRVPILTEIQEAFGTIKEGAFDPSTGELTFKAKLLTDGEGGYVVTDIKVANEGGEV